MGIELLLAADIRVAAADARFAQIEVLRGIFPFDAAEAQAQARELAHTIADRAAPLAVRATLASEQLARADGVQSFVERRPARFAGC